MVTVAIICEYNPFHTGHAYHINKIREEFGSDTSIVAIMSGNFTQRGEIACIGKAERAKCASEAGIDLVLELPFPYSTSSAEIFASAGVKIADSLGVVDFLSFGSESGNKDDLVSAAKVLLSSKYKKEFDRLGEDKTLGYPERCEKAFYAASGNTAFEFTPNNILAIEYIKALKVQKSKIRIHTVRRMGASYDDKNISNATHQSAMAIRDIMKIEPNNSLCFIPETSKSILFESFKNGDAPTDEKFLSSALISYFRLNPPMQNKIFYDAGDGLYNRLYNASFKANDISSLIELTETKKFTNARLRRAMWNAFFGVTSSDVKTLPMYTQILAMNKKGMLLLKNSKKHDDFRILTKPSDFDDFSATAMRQKLLSDKADSIFELSKPKPKFGKSALTFTPYIKK